MLSLESEKGPRKNAPDLFRRELPQMSNERYQPPTGLERLSMVDERACAAAKCYGIEVYSYGEDFKA